MSRPVMLAVVGLGLGLLGGTGVGALKGRATAMAAMDSIARHEADSLAAHAADTTRMESEPTHAAEPDSSAPSGEATDSAGLAPSGAPADELPAVTVAADTEPPPRATGAPVSGAPAGASASPEADEDRQEAPRRLAKIFGAMRAEDAAAVLLGLGDRDVRAILEHVSNRTAAAILAELPPERAASLSRSVLTGGGGGTPPALEASETPPDLDGPASSTTDTAVVAGPSAPLPDSLDGLPPIPTAPDPALMDSIRAMTGRLDPLGGGAADASGGAR